MSKPLISVLIDTYNHERFIAEAVQSVLSQDFPAADREILVVDDGSTDRTPEILRQFGDQIRVLRKPNGGQASAFNHGIPECRGEIIAFLDGDDWWQPGKLKSAVEPMMADRALGVVGHGFDIVSATGSCTPVCLDAPLRFQINSVPSAEYFRLIRCFFGTSRLTLRSDIARKILPVPPALIFEADEFLFTLGPVFSEALLLPRRLTCYRMHGANLFLAAGGSEGGERRKQRVLESLASELSDRLQREGVPSDVSSVLTGMVNLEAAQLRLKLQGGSPLETLRIETALYRIQHPHVSLRSRIFRFFSMIPALLLPPRWFYAGRGWLSSQRWYLAARKTVLPSPAHIPEEFPANASSAWKEPT